MLCSCSQKRGRNIESQNLNFIFSRLHRDRLPRPSGRTLSRSTVRSPCATRSAVFTSNGKSMSPFLQRKQRSGQPTSPDSTSPPHTPQQWLRPAFNQSLPNLAKSSHPHRTLGFSSIKQLARSSRQTQNQSQAQRLRSSSSLYGTLRDQCTPPAPETHVKGPESSELELQHSHNSSTESITRDYTGLSIDSSHPTTPSPGKPRAFCELNIASPRQAKSMGQIASSLTRKPLSIKAKQSLATFRGEKEREPSTPNPEVTPQGPSATKPQPEKPSLQVQVPRRRSSLTAIHLDSSHFDTIDPKHPSLQHRSSTLTEPARRPSGLSESIRPIISNTGTVNTTFPTRETLSPPLLSPPISTSRASSAASSSPSDNPRTSPIPPHIHLPKTFPQGPVPIPAPPLTIVHMKCYQGHRRMVPSPNKFNPVPCMVCKQEEHDKRWRCPFCALRLCGPCKAEFDRRGRDLEAVVFSMDQLKEEEAKAAEWIKENMSPGHGKEDSAENKWKENGGMQTPDPERLRKKKMRETM